MSSAGLESHVAPCPVSVQLSGGGALPLLCGAGLYRHATPGLQLTLAVIINCIVIIIIGVIIVVIFAGMMMLIVMSVIWMFDEINMGSFKWELVFSKSP